MKRFPFICGLILISCSFIMFSCNRNKVTCGACKFELLPDSVWDLDYNLYSQVRIGDQIWLGENLRSLHYADGSVIDNLDNVIGGRYEFPMGQVDSAVKYGVLYNWAAARHLNDEKVMNDRVQGICPEGFHLPSADEWNDLVFFVSNCSSAPIKVSPAKSLAANDSSWNISTVPNTPGCGLDSNNVSLFGAMPAGHCFMNENTGVIRFYNFHSGANFWSSTPYDYTAGDANLSNPNAYGRYIGYDDVKANRTVSNKKAYLSVRCVKNK